MLSQRVDLRFPIELPGGTISHVVARPLTQASYDLAQTGPEGQLEAFAAAAGLPEAVVLEMTDLDYERVTKVIAGLHRQAAEVALADRRSTLTLIKGKMP